MSVFEHSLCVCVPCTSSLHLGTRCTVATNINEYTDNNSNTRIKLSPTSSSAGYRPSPARALTTAAARSLAPTNAVSGRRVSMSVIAPSSTSCVQTRVATPARAATGAHLFRNAREQHRARALRPRHARQARLGSRPIERAQRGLVHSQRRGVRGEHAHERIQQQLVRHRVHTLRPPHASAGARTPSRAQHGTHHTKHGTHHTKHTSHKNDITTGQ